MTRIHCLKIQKFTKKVGGEPFNGNRRKVKHHYRLSDSAPPPKMRNGVCLKSLLTFLRETKWPRIAEKNTLSQCAPRGEMLASLYSLVLEEILLRIWTALPQLIP